MKRPPSFEKKAAFLDFMAILRHGIALARRLFNGIISSLPEDPKERRIGFGVMGGGVLAVVIVCIFAFSERPDLGRSSIDARTAQMLKTDLTSAPEAQQTYVPPEPKKDLYFNRQPLLRASDVQGSWQAAIGRYTAVLQLSGNVYQIIMAEPDTMKRIYSAGVFSMSEDMLVLTPRLDWADPSSRGGAKVPYEILTRAPFPIISAIIRGKMVWQNPPQSEDRLLVPSETPLTAGQDVDYIVWQRLK